ncbi:PucR family transcriptional regulator [Tsukamurella soli]|uniref:PucR C-terminal helix-turn-helix domain-containing protein n=1 Tax=Tsukamurella soli TaxID=644556 RepID=A0ABP8JTN5_9ACTN
MRHDVELDDRVQDAAESAGRPLVLLDARLRPVAWSIHESAADREGLSVVLAHSSSWPPPSGSVGYVPAAGAGTVAVIALGDRGATAGHLAVRLRAAERQLAAHEITRILRAGSTLLPALLSRPPEAAPEHTVALVRALVAGDPDAAAALVEESLISESSRYCAVAIGARPDLAERVTPAVDVVVGFVHLASTASVVGATGDDGVGVLVFPRPVVVPRLTRLLAEPRIAGVRAGIGPLVPSLTQAASSYDGARRVLRATLAAPDRHPVVASAADVGVDAWLVEPSCTVDDLPRAVAVLLRDPGSAPLLETVETYLETGGNALQAARQLHIHRSTLYYRLDRIRELVGVESIDAALRFELAVGIRIARLNGLASTQ